jgi:predicted nuclease of restriction endonuclease-like (RecB) superfamily
VQRFDRLSRDLRTAFPEMKGFSRANLLYMRAFAEAWPDAVIVQQVVGQLPWAHNITLITRLKEPQCRIAYAQAAVQHGWSRSVLDLHIETRRLATKQELPLGSIAIFSTSAS